MQADAHGGEGKILLTLGWMFRARTARRWAFSRGFGIAEALLAIGLIAVALMALIAQSTVLMGAAQKGDDTSVAGSVARTQLDRIAQAAMLDQPAGQRLAIWNQDNASVPYLQASEKVGNTEYTVELFVSNVVNAGTGATLGSGPTGAENPKTRLKQLEATVTWWDSKKQEHHGMGKLELRAARLLKVAYEAPP